VLRSLSLSVPGRTAHSLQELHAIVDAVLAGDADAAAAACSRHVEEAGRTALAALEEESQHSP
jgi:DNA-binding GntR family transcriptional regulator